LCDVFYYLQCFDAVGWVANPACKKQSGGVLAWLSVLHRAQLMPLPLTVSCFSKILIGFSFLVAAHPGSQRAVKRRCVCVCVLFDGLTKKSWQFLISICCGFVGRFLLLFLILHSFISPQNVVAKKNTKNRT